MNASFEMLTRGYSKRILAELEQHYSKHRSAPEWMTVLHQDYPAVPILVNRLNAAVRSFYGEGASVSFAVVADGGFANSAKVVISTSASGEVLAFDLNEWNGLKQNGAKSFDDAPVENLKRIEDAVLSSFKRNVNFQPAKKAEA